MKKRTKAFLLQAPLFLLILIAFVASLVLKISGLFDLSWGTPILLLIVIGAYFYGRKLESETEVLIRN